jgi:hypothetical protein
VSRSNNRPVFLLVVAATALILACGPRAHRNDAAAAKRDASIAASPSRDTTVAASAGVSVGSDVQFTLHVTNLHDRGVELRFPTGQTYAFSVVDSAGREIWSSSEGRLFTQALQNKLLGSRETLTFAERWNGGGHSGRYTAVASLRSSNHPVEERVEFVLP